MCNETECEGNEKVPNIDEGSASGNVREMEPELSPDKEKGGPPPCTAGTEQALRRSPDTRPLDNKNGEVDKAHVVTGIIVTPAATGKKPAAAISSCYPLQPITEERTTANTSVLSSPPTGAVTNVNTRVTPPSTARGIIPSTTVASDQPIPSPVRTASRNGALKHRSSSMTTAATWIGSSRRRRKRGRRSSLDVNIGSSFVGDDGDGASDGGYPDSMESSPRLCLPLTDSPNDRESDRDVRNGKDDRPFDESLEGGDDHKRCDSEQDEESSTSPHEDESPRGNGAHPWEKNIGEIDNDSTSPSRSQHPLEDTQEEAGSKSTVAEQDKERKIRGCRKRRDTDTSAGRSSIATSRRDKQVTRAKQQWDVDKEREFESSVLPVPGYEAMHRRRKGVPRHTNDNSTAISSSESVADDDAIDAAEIGADDDATDNSEIGVSQESTTIRALLNRVDAELDLSQARRSVLSLQDPAVETIRLRHANAKLRTDLDLSRKDAAQLAEENNKLRREAGSLQKRLSTKSKLCKELAQKLSACHEILTMLPKDFRASLNGDVNGISEGQLKCPKTSQEGEAMEFSTKGEIPSKISRSQKKKGKKRKCRGDASTDGMGQNTIAGVLEHSTEVESPPERSRYPPNKEKRRRLNSDDSIDDTVLNNLGKSPKETKRGKIFTDKQSSTKKIAKRAPLSPTDNKVDKISRTLRSHHTSENENVGIGPWNVLFEVSVFRAEVQN